MEESIRLAALEALLSRVLAQLALRTPDPGISIQNVADWAKAYSRDVPVIGAEDDETARAALRRSLGKLIDVARGDINAALAGKR